LISEDELNDEAVAGTLHLHHIVYFAEGGPNTEDNLLLVCPTCHAKIHDQPERYPKDTLREAKRHWIRMRDLVPHELDYEEEGGGAPQEPRLRVPFTVESFNLHFLIQVPTSITVQQLGQFVGNWILRPLVFYCRTAPYKSVLAKAYIGRIGLALKSEPEDALPSHLLIGEIPGLTSDSLVALTDVRMVAALLEAGSKGVDDEDEVPAVEKLTLRWGAVPRDLDLHFFHRSDVRDAHISFRHKGTLEEYPWARLAEDITRGYGPEILTFGLLSRGTYTVAIHNFSGEVPLAGCGATLEVAIAATVRSHRCPDVGKGAWWVVLELDVERKEVLEVNQIVSSLANMERSGSS
jgi:hypothetical protein